jgi:hypothetical protein
MELNYFVLLGCVLFFFVWISLSDEFDNSFVNLFSALPIGSGFFVFLMYCDFIVGSGYVVKHKEVDINNADLIEINRHRDTLNFSYIDEYGLESFIKGLDLKKIKNITFLRGEDAKLSINFFKDIQHRVVNYEEIKINVTLPPNVKIPNLRNKKEQFFYSIYKDFGYKRIQNKNCYTNVKLENDLYKFYNKYNYSVVSYDSNIDINIQKTPSLNDKFCIDFDFYYRKEDKSIYQSENHINRMTLKVPIDYDIYSLYTKKQP